MAAADESGPSEASAATPARDDAVPRGITVGSFAEVVRAGVFSPPAVRRAAKSSWRFPERPGELPVYVKRSFRFKTFGLVSLQLALVLAQMVLVENVVSTPAAWLDHLPSPQALFYLFGLSLLVLLLMLQSAVDSFPVNYVLLVAVTLMGGCFWGLSHEAFHTWLQFQVIGNMCVTTGIAAVASATLSSREMRPQTLLLAAVLPAWAAASAASLCALAWLPAGLGVTTTSAMAADLVVLFLLVAVLAFDAGPMLVRCNPDDFMRVIVSMDSVLLIVVSLPIFVVSCCLMHSPVSWDPEGQEAHPENAEERPDVPISP